MVCIKRIFLIMVMTFVCSMTSFAQLPDPKEILIKSESAVKNIKSISYRAEFYTIGTLKYGDADAILTPYRGDVLLIRSDSEDPFGGRFSVQAERIKTQSDKISIPFKVAYDGRKIRKFISKEKVVYVNDPDQNGKALTLGIFDLILKDFQIKEPLQKVLNAEKLQYDGVGVIGGIPCHIIHAVYSGDSFPRESWWFISIDDFLPRKVQRLGYGLPNQEISRVLLLTDLKTNISIDPSFFTIDAPEGYSVKVYQRKTNVPTPTLQAGNDAPDWKLQDEKGSQYALKDLSGKILIIDFWATWCGPCREAMPILQRLHEKYRDKGVVVVGINTWESGDPAKFMKERGYTYLSLLHGGEVANKYGVNGIPTLYVIDLQGKILYGEVGFGPESESKLIKIIDENISIKKRN